MSHIPVLLQEVISGLDFQEGDIFLDCTLNRAGHSVEVARRFGQKVKIIGIDLDASALQDAEKVLQEAHADFQLKQSNFKDLDKVLDEIGIPKVNKVLMDLGFSSNQMDDSGRGFSFQKNEPLLMTLKDNPSASDLTAREVVNEWQESSLADIIYGFGGEQKARRIAREIVLARELKPIETTFDLVAIIEKAVPRRGKIHPATKTFQAIRIAVNSELQVAKEGIEKAFERLQQGGRVAVISFHSLEDRIMKNFCRDAVKKGEAKFVNKKPIVPSREEEKNNPRARSAKLRIIEKI